MVTSDHGCDGTIKLYGLVLSFLEKAPAIQEASVCNIADRNPVSDYSMLPVSSLPTLVIYFCYDIGTEGKQSGPQQLSENHTIAVCSQGL